MSLLSKIAMWAELLGSGEAKQAHAHRAALAWRVRELESINEFADVEFSVFSQFATTGSSNG
ncbi:hypothetical protein I545_6892 [Mycobacterium kansasii 662]|uniref:Uncharacterized protein n=1 Tax=Mycobacterium kansasii 662 TaxID=1299326 RepID=X7XPC8_MYCKA|nr:hypothetical protein [Mycobacterium kansasii]ETZ96756.1 hypothetical protein I545_6892 [Mycobacterium kansasii 662]